MRVEACDLHQVEEAAARNVVALEEFSPRELLFEHCQLRRGHARAEGAQLRVDIALDLDQNAFICCDAQNCDQPFFKCFQNLLAVAEVIAIHCAHGLCQVVDLCSKLRKCLADCCGLFSQILEILPRLLC